MNWASAARCLLRVLEDMSALHRKRLLHPTLITATMITSAVSEGPDDQHSP